ncbi:MAG TPA: universal stress protein [Hydrogenophaga sp.]|uniref:universal stress protein n=1 Tax=Hydrogenophaga sp. TaxID=1904254 RepID=UPI002C39602E|nr:universal stress protein [Hydrogenophaga sp.]HMN92681.1 universal stress protein [Hydrogenophaga sp.]
MKILLPVDGSAFTKKMLAYLTTHPELFGTGNTYTLLSVQQPLPPRARAAVGSEIAQGFYAEEGEKVTAPVLKFLGQHGMAVKVIHKGGRAADIIAQTATAGKVDPVVMGSPRHTALGNLVMGSVATRVLANCKTPVLLVR